MIHRLRGWKTLVIFSPIFLLSLLDALRVFDFTPIFDAIGISQTNRATIIALMSLGTIFLRIYSTTPVMRAEPQSCHEPPCDRDERH